jgi:hypothetical protein
LLVLGWPIARPSTPTENQFSKKIIPVAFSNEDSDPANESAELTERLADIWTAKGMFSGCR